jgi:hypothetical protein
VILLDTNVLSALMRQRPDAEVIHWLDRQARTSVWTTSITPPIAAILGIGIISPCLQPKHWGTRGRISSPTVMLGTYHLTSLSRNKHHGA